MKFQLLYKRTLSKRNHAALLEGSSGQYGRKHGLVFGDWLKGDGFLTTVWSGDFNGYRDLVII